MMPGIETDEQRYTRLVETNRALDAQLDAIHQGLTVAPVLAAAGPLVFQDGLGGFYTMPEPEPRAARGRTPRPYFGTPWLDGPIAKALHSENSAIFSNCPCPRCRGTVPTR